MTTETTARSEQIEVAASRQDALFFSVLSLSSVVPVGLLFLRALCALRVITQSHAIGGTPLGTR
jgi:hypothetical protein